MLSSLDSWKLADVDSDPFSRNGDILREVHLSRRIERINPCDTFYEARAGIVVATFIDCDPFQDVATRSVNKLTLLILWLNSESERRMGESEGALAQRYPGTLTHITSDGVVTVILS